MSHLRQADNFLYCPHKQRGAALMVMLVIMVMGAATFLVSSLSKSGLQIESDKKTVEALAQAKEALIGYAASVDLTGSKRPGDLPCPDTNNDGLQETSCGNASGTTGQTLRIGRLPWKTLGLPDLRDGSGERLWYAVSNNFKYNTRTTCTNSNLTGCLNSDTPGTITVRGSTGNIINNGCSVYGLPNCPNPIASDAAFGTGVVAVIISPGDVLQRQGALSPQNRSCTIGVDCDATEKCTTTPPTLAPKCDPVNYLDNVTAGDNANFIDGSSTTGFIQGRIKDNSGNVILNDQLLVITQDNIMQTIQKRVVAEVKNCLIEYAAIPQNNNYYPWAATRTVIFGQATYPDTSGLTFGRVPDQFFVNTCDDTGGSNCDEWYESGGMENSWGPACNLANSNWWVNWKEMVFYGMTYYQRPHNLTHTHNCSTNACLAVNPPSPATDKPFVVIVAGKKIGAQVRSSDAEKNTFANYLEGQNSDSASPFEKSTLSSTYNDWVVFP